MPRARRWMSAATAASVVLVALGATGCGSGVQERGSPDPSTAATTTSTSSAPVPTTSDTIPTDSAGICDALARIAAADRSSTQQSQGLDDWDDLQPLIVENAAAAVDLYDAALEVAPEELSERLVQIRDVTAAAGEAAAAAESEEAFQAAGQDLPGFAEAQAAVEEVNRFSQRTCGFTLADN